MSLREPGKVETAHLFGPLHEALVELLRELRPEDWHRTANASWTVREMAAHLLDGDLRRLSHDRDALPRPAPPAGPEGYDGLVSRLDGRNARWIEATRGLSPQVLTELLEVTGPRVAAFFARVDPDREAPLPVAWAGQERSPNWMDVGREYIERWHHQQQIRDAVGSPALTGPRWLEPLLALGVRAIPPAYAGVDEPEGTRVRLEIPGEAGGSWVVERTGRRRKRGGNGWRLRKGGTEHPDVRVHMEPALAWRLLLRGLPDRDLRAGVEVEGRAELARPLFAARALMVRRGGSAG
jgi:uncharacterized protein (TIGR03083 family)